MIKYIISEIKKVTKNNYEKRLEAIHTIERILEEIDFSSEVVPTQDLEKLKSLLTNLKGNSLTANELEIVNEITVHKAH
jgi:hypothetical protein